MVTRAEWYTRVNSTWPHEEHENGTLPKLTAEEAIRAAKKLYRFARGKTFSGKVVVTSGNRYTWIRGAVIYVNPSRGWEALVHLLSHALYPSLKHGGAHARAEIRLIKEVVRRGWLAGALKTQAKPAATPPDPATAKQTALRAKLEQKMKLRKGWETKKKRAETAITKYNRSIAQYERLLRAQA